MSKSKMLLISLLILVAISLAACAGSSPATPAPAADQPQAEQAEAPAAKEEVAVEEKEEAETNTEETAKEEVAASERVQIRWFVGLGTGGNPEQVEVQEKVVQEFNASQDQIELVLEIVDNTTAAQTLQTQIASGNPPDIIGPVGTRGSNSFAGLFMDLQPYVEKSSLDLSVFDPALVDFYRVEGEGLLGLPFAVYPAVIFYNRDLFDEAGLPYPPHKVGEKYDGKDWDIATLEEVALKLTVDANGNDATSSDFDPDKIEQYGFFTQWTEEDPRAEWTLFGPGSLIDENGKAVLPDHWREAAQWYYAGVWEKHFIPSIAAVNSDLLAAGNPFNSGNLGMAHVNSWYTCCLADVPNWDIGVVPSYDGKNTAKLHADTFRIMKATQHPDEAFTVLTHLLNSADLLQVYGAMPANKTMQEAFFAGLEKQYSQGVDWSVITASLALADNPSHEAAMPNFLKADERNKAFGSLYRSQPDLDLEAELDKWLADLQVIFSETPQQ